MFTRTTGMFVVPLWLAAMGWLVAHDVWPALTAQEPPLLQPTDWLREEGRQAQFTLYHDEIEIGTIWTEYTVGQTSVQRTDVIWIQQFPLPIAPLRLLVTSVFTPDGLFDEFTVALARRGTNLNLHGERFHADFSFEFRNGPITSTFKIPLTSGDLIGGGFNPFGQLTDLRVGQTWRMQVFNPVAVLTGVGRPFSPLLVRVTEKTTLDQPTGAVECFVVKAAGVTAWVDESGTTVAQEVDVPLLGRLTIRAETLDVSYRQRALSLLPKRRGGHQLEDSLER